MEGYRNILKLRCRLVAYKAFSKNKKRSGANFSDVFSALFLNENIYTLHSIKEVRYNCSAHRSAHLFIIAISSHSHIRRKQPQRTFL